MERDDLYPAFQDGLTRLLNEHNLDTAAGTPDWLLAGMLTEFYETFRLTRALTEGWRGGDDPR